jgi:ATP-binding cassette subfamily B protein
MADTRRTDNKVGRRGRGGMMRGVVDKPKDFKGSMKSLIQYLKPHRLPIIFVILFSILGTVFTIISPKMLGNITNDIAEDYISIRAYEEIYKQLPQGTVIPEGTTGEFFLQQVPQEQKEKIPENMLDALNSMDLSQKPGIDFESIKSTILILIGLYILSLIFSYSEGLIVSNVTQKVTYQLRKEISQKIHLLPLKYYDNRQIGDVMSVIINDVDTIGQSLNQSLNQIIRSVTLIIGITVMMFSISWRMAIVILLILPLSAVITSFIIKRSQKYFAKQQRVLGSLYGHMEETYAGYILIKAFNKEDSVKKDFEGDNHQLYESGWKSQFFSGLIFPIISFVGNIGYIAVAVLGGWLSIRNLITLGDIQAFLQYVNQFNQPLRQAATITNVLQATAAASERVFDLLKEEEEIKDSEDAIELKNVRGDISFKNVVFSYDGKTNVIKNFTADIKSGQRVAIVGPTGAGKTTIVNLLMRFYDVKSGSIELDGIDIRNIKKASLRAQFGMVLQDTWLFNGTIKENLKYGRKEVSDEEIYRATDITQIDHVIRSLPGGYNMKINEDADNLSQGEKQLLTIARAMLADAPILILDEATSSVDTRTEVLIQNAMDKLMEGRTSFVIAHRLSTIKNADLILVIRDGNIVEKGKHEELLKKNGFYAEMYNSQFEIV